MSNQVTISYGDTEESAELMESAMSIIAEAGAVLEIDTTQLGAEPRKLGYDSGFHDDTTKKFICSRVLLKTPDDVTPNLLTAFEISDARETYGDEHPAQVFANDGFAIFEPSEATAPAMLNAAIMVLKHLGQTDVAERIISAMKQVKDSSKPAQYSEEIIKKLY